MILRKRCLTCQEMIVMQDTSLSSYAKIKYHPECKPKSYSKKMNDYYRTWRKHNPHYSFMTNIRKFFHNPIRLLTHGDWV